MLVGHTSSHLGQLPNVISKNSKMPGLLSHIPKLHTTNRSLILNLSHLIKLIFNITNQLGKSNSNSTNPILMPNSQVMNKM